MREELILSEDWMSKTAFTLAEVKSKFPHPLGRGLGRGIKAFTLAEVLITLGVIGVIASITIPALIIKYQKLQTVTRLQKAYSLLGQAFERAKVDNGDVSEWDWESEDFAEKYIVPYLKIAKKCVGEDTACNKTANFLNGEKQELPAASYPYVIYTTDGYRFMIGNIANNRVQIYIDINGDKKPNTQGKDMFVTRFNDEFDKVKGKLTFTGHELTREEMLSIDKYACAKDKIGHYCGALIMHDGWQIKDDYPW